MLENVNQYFLYQEKKYIKPEKAGVLSQSMLDLRELAQSARKEFIVISQLLAEKVKPFEAERVSQWMNQAQICRPHFWCYYRFPSDDIDEVTLAIRLYGKYNDFGVSVEVNFIERKKSEKSLIQQRKVLNCPITAPSYYLAQNSGISYKIEGNEENRMMLMKKVERGEFRKVLIKQDVPYVKNQTVEELIDRIAKVFDGLVPYYEETKKINTEMKHILEVSYPS
ncbi:ribonuclease P [Lactococcus garvieae]|nr:ribonuclease P [Lactococcus garvieae]NHJ17903.1 ribonuclease P [Lactococcus garvieae]